MNTKFKIKKEKREHVGSYFKVGNVYYKIISLSTRASGIKVYKLMSVNSINPGVAVADSVLVNTYEKEIVFKENYKSILACEAPMILQKCEG